MVVGVNSSLSGERVVAGKGGVLSGSLKDRIRFTLVYWE